jgi:hypothetical protein
MAQSNSTSLVQNGVITLQVPRRAKAITVQTGPDNHASAAIKLQGRMKDEWDWSDIALHDPSETDATLFVTSLTGPGQHGIAPASALSYKYLQIVRTDANGGVCLVAVGTATSED